MTAFRLSRDVRPVRYALHFELDLDAWRFVGRERCEIELDGPVRKIVLHAVDLELSEVVARSGSRSHRPRVTFDAPNETATLAFDDELAAGEWAVELRLAGDIRADLKALYRSTRGDERYAITTLWPAEARRLYACFDEPPFKARFALELVAASGLTAIANARMTESRELGDGRTLWRFAETPPLSPYLLAFAVGPFDGTPETRTQAGVPVRIWVPRGLSADGEYARDAQRDCIDRLVEYTAMAYPYDKVEGVGVADFPAGAMENPGAVTYRLELVTTHPAKASARALKSTVSVAAHELTHMWWGDLVTLAWWDDLWLSESFATFVGNKVEDELHPEWRIWRDFVTGTTAGFALDALASTHAIHAEAESAAAALQRIDQITYQKGASVLRMIETYIGEDRFRAGVRLYLERFRESSATATDFWRALDEASGEDVSRVARAWITEPGHPIVEMREDGGHLALQQRRFFLDPGASDTGQRWPIPLVLRTSAGETRTLLEEGTGRIERPTGEWLFPNARAAGFYRFSLDAPLRRGLLANLERLTPEERLLLVDNEWALLLAGESRAGDHVALLRALSAERDRAVLAAALEQLRWLEAHAVAPAERGPFARLVGDVFGSAMESLGMDPRPGDDEDTQELRGLAIRAMGQVGASRSLRHEAAERIAAHLDGRPQDRNLVAAFAAVAAIEGDAALQARYVDRIRAGDPQEVERFRRALALFRDDAATAATLARVDDRTVRDQDLRDIFWFGFRNTAQRRTYWRAFQDRYESRIAPLEGIVRNFLILAVVELTPPDLAAEADAFLANVRVPDAVEIVGRAREGLRLQSAAAQRIGRELLQV